MGVGDEIDGLHGFLLANAGLVESFGVFAGVDVVLCQGNGEVVCAAEILLGTHIYKIMSLRCEHGIDASERRNADRARRQSFIDIGVVWVVAP